MSVTRQSLLLRARGGDESAWSDLIAVYRPLLMAWLRQQDVPPSDRDDLLQEILIAVVRYLPSFHHSGHLGALPHLAEDDRLQPDGRLLEVARGGPRRRAATSPRCCGGWSSPTAT